MVNYWLTKNSSDKYSDQKDVTHQTAEKERYDILRRPSFLKKQFVIWICPFQ